MKHTYLCTTCGNVWTYAGACQMACDVCDGDMRRVEPGSLGKIRAYFVGKYREGLGKVKGCTPGPWWWYGTNLLDTAAKTEESWGFVIEICDAGLSITSQDRALIASAPDMAAEICQLREELKEARLIAEPEKAPRFNAFAHQRQQDEIKKLCEKNLEIEGLRKMDMVVLLSSAEKIVALEKSNAELLAALKSVDHIPTRYDGECCPWCKCGVGTGNGHFEHCARDKAIANAENGE